jgi:hypothetical protein
MTNETAQGEVSNQNKQSQANQDTQQTNKTSKKQETKPKEKSLAKEAEELFNAPRESIREAVKGYTEKRLHLPFEEEIPPEEEKKKEKKKGGKGKKRGKKGGKGAGAESQQSTESQQLAEGQQLKAPRSLKQRLKQSISDFIRRKGPRLTKKAIESVPLPPTPYGEVERFVERVVIEVPTSNETNLLMAFAMLAGMYGIAALLIFIDNIIGQYLWPFWLTAIVVVVLLFPYLITSFLMWFTLYLTTFSSISAIFANIANKIWSQGNYYRTLSPRAVVYYALAMVLYMATAKTWVGIVAGYFLALPSFIFFTIIQEIFVYALILISVMTAVYFTMGLLLASWVILTSIYISAFFGFSVISMYWSRYITKSMDIHRLLAVWLIVAVRELLAPQMAYLAVAGFAIYAGIQAALSVGTPNSNYRYINMLPAVIILAVTPTGTLNMVSQTVITAVDQAFQYMASYDKWNYLMLSAQTVAKWLLSVIPPW